MEATNSKKTLDCMGTIASPFDVHVKLQDKGGSTSGENVNLHMKDNWTEAVGHKIETGETKALALQMNNHHYRTSVVHEDTHLDHCFHLIQETMQVLVGTVQPARHDDTATNLLAEESNHPKAQSHPRSDTNYKQLATRLEQLLETTKRITKAHKTHVQVLQTESAKKSQRLEIAREIVKRYKAIQTGK